MVQAGRTQGTAAQLTNDGVSSRGRHRARFDEDSAGNRSGTSVARPVASRLLSKLFRPRRFRADQGCVHHKANNERTSLSSESSSPHCATRPRVTLLRRQLQRRQEKLLNSIGCVFTHAIDVLPLLRSLRANLTTQCPIEPRLGEPPIAVDRTQRDAQLLSHLFSRKASEKLHFDNLRRTRIVRGQFLERFIQLKYINRIGRYPVLSKN